MSNEKATAPLLKQPSENPDDFASEATVIDMQALRNEQILCFSELIDALEQGKPTPATKRFTEHVVDALLWRLFKIAMIILACALTIGAFCLVYFLWFKDDVDSAVYSIKTFFIHLSATVERTLVMLEGIYKYTEEAVTEVKHVAKVMEKEVLNSDDPLDAIALAFN
jgi:hypothetical protein